LKFIADGICKAKILDTDPAASAIEQALGFIERVVRAGSTCQLMEIHLHNMFSSVKNFKEMDGQESDDVLRQLVYILIQALKYATESFLERGKSEMRDQHNEEIESEITNDTLPSESLQHESVQPSTSLQQLQQGDGQTPIDTAPYLMHEPKLEEMEECAVSSDPVEPGFYNDDMPSTSQQQQHPTMRAIYYEWMEEKVKQEDLLHTADANMDGVDNGYAEEYAGGAEIVDSPWLTYPEGLTAQTHYTEGVSDNFSPLPDDSAHSLDAAAAAAAHDRPEFSRPLNRQMARNIAHPKPPQKIVPKPGLLPVRMWQPARSVQQLQQQPQPSGPLLFPVKRAKKTLQEQMEEEIRQLEEEQHLKQLKQHRVEQLRQLASAQQVQQQQKEINRETKRLQLQLEREEKAKQPLPEKKTRKRRRELPEEKNELNDEGRFQCTACTSSFETKKELC
ncbi:hypothetical protein PFISCL1PPCAC_27863, partial [Pristionchus fissidentatus]